jgi:hypothetical protein
MASAPGCKYPEQQSCQKVIGSLEQLLGFCRVGDMLHALRRRSMRDDFGALKELVSPHVVAILVRVDHALRHTPPKLAEQLNHLTPVGQVRLCVETTPPPRLMSPELASHTRFFLVQDREAVVADLLQLHQGAPAWRFWGRTSRTHQRRSMQRR